MMRRFSQEAILRRRAAATLSHCVHCRAFPQDYVRSMLRFRRGAASEQAAQRRKHGSVIIARLAASVSRQSGLGL